MEAKIFIGSNENVLQEKLDTFFEEHNYITNHHWRGLPGLEYDVAFFRKFRASA